MDYTRSDSHIAIGARRAHQETQPVPTAVSADDLNSVRWSLMRIIEDATVAPRAFDAADSSSYGVLLSALHKIIDRDGRRGPVGSVVTGYLSRVSDDGMSLLLDGGTYARSKYPALWSHVLSRGLAVREVDWIATPTLFSLGDGVSTFRVPRLSDLFVRVAGDSRATGSYQADELAAHGHGIRTDDGDGWNPSSPGGQVRGTDRALVVTVITNTTGGDETRPKNVALVARVFY